MVNEDATFNDDETRQFLNVDGFLRYLKYLLIFYSQCLLYLFHFFLFFISTYCAFESYRVPVGGSWCKIFQKAA